MIDIKPQSGQIDSMIGINQVKIVITVGKTMRKTFIIFVLGLSFCWSYHSFAQAKSITRFTLGSCFAPQLSDAMWPVMGSYKPQLHIALGDNVYQAQENHDMQQPNLAAAYELLRGTKGFVDFANNVEILPTWDDHDFGFNDAGGSFKPKKRSQQLFNQMWQIPKDDLRTTRDGIYHAQIYGTKGQKAQFILLDTRFFRSDVIKKDGQFPIINEDNATMLGNAQWQWLENQLAKPADVRFIVTSVQLLTTNRIGEGWYTMPKQRQKLLELIAKAKNTIVLSGDRHFANFYQSRHIVEMTSSSLNLPITGQARERFSQMKEPFAQGASVLDANFGLVEIDWQNRKVSLAIIDETKKVRKTMAVNF